MQTLRRIIALCSHCHLATHFGHATATGRADEAFADLRQVTGMDQAQAREDVRAAEQVWLARSARVWELDLSMLTGAGIEVRLPASAVGGRPRTRTR